MIGQFIFDHVKRQNMCLSVAAIRSEVDRSTLYQIVRGNLPLTVNMAWRLERGIGIDAAYLLELEIKRRRKEALNGK